MFRHYELVAFRNDLRIHDMSQLLKIHKNKDLKRTVSTDHLLLKP